MTEGLTDPEPRLSAEWLRERLPDSAGRLHSVAFERVGVFSTEVWRARLRTDDADSAARASLILKRPVPGRLDRSAEGFGYEIRTYREVAPRLPVRVPRLVFASDDPPWLLIEDVPAVEPFHWNASREHLRLAMEQLADVHAASLAWTHELDWVPHLGDQDVLAGFERAFALGWQTARDAFASAVPGFASIGDAIAGRVAATLAPLGDFASLLHGDAHGENIPIVRDPHGAPDLLFLDWAGPRRGNPAFDVAVFLAMSCPVQTRRRVERELVAQHDERLRSHGFARVDPIDDYRRALLRRVVRIVEIAAERADLVAHPGFRFVVERCLTAAVDWDTRDLIV